MATEITCANCGDTIPLRERNTRGWDYHAGPPVKYFCPKPQCQAEYRKFVDETSLGPSR